MRRLILTLAVIVIATMGTMAQNYTLHSATSGVKVLSAGKTADAKKGLQLKASDTFIIPEGGLVEVYNNTDKRIYKSLRPGKVSVTKLLIEARQVAADNSKNVSSRLTLGKNGTGSGKKAYVEKGMVTREHLEADSLEITECPEFLPECLPDSLSVCPRQCH